MKTKAFFLVIWVSHLAFSQTIYKSSIDNGGASVVNAHLEMVYTIGEVNVQELTVSDFSISEGFIGADIFGPAMQIPFNKSFVTGWNWFSVNLDADDMSLGTLLTCVTQGDYIKNQTEFATYYDGPGWFGSLANAGGLDPTEFYKIRVTNPCEVSYSGTPVDVLATPIDIVPGWNWIGYLPQCPFLLIPDNEALVSLTLEQGDYIKNQIASSTYYDPSGWFGPLVEMAPTEGYMLRIQSPGTLIYPECPTGPTGAKKGANDAEQNVSFSFNPYPFEFSGTVTARIYVDGVLAGNEEDLILAYVGDQLRGISKGYYFDPVGAYAYPLMIHSNIQDGETIKFRYYYAKNDQMYPCDETLVFAEDMIVADAFESFELHVNSAVSMEDVADGLDKPTLKVYPNPFKDQLHIEYTITEPSKVRLAIYDMLGKVVEYLVVQTLDPGSYSTEFITDSYPESTYLIRLSTDSGSFIKKICLVK